MHRRDQLALAAMWPFSSGTRSARPVTLSAAGTDAAQVPSHPSHAANAELHCLRINAPQSCSNVTSRCERCYIHQHDCGLIPVLDRKGVRHVNMATIQILPLCSNLLIFQVLEAPKWPEEFPFRDDFFNCYDESSDTLFYDSPRFVTHIDDNAIKALTQYYDRQFPSDDKARSELAVLDMCSSWISHYPQGFKAQRVAGTHSIAQYNKYLRRCIQMLPPYLPRRCQVSRNQQAR